MENIAKTSSIPHEASPKIQDLEITQLKTRVKTLEDNEKRRERLAQEDALNTGGRGWIKDRICTLGAANILASGGLRSVFTTASLLVATASTIVSFVVATASGSFPTAPSKKKILEQMSVQLARDLEAKFAQEDQIIREQSERDSEIARIHAKRELEMMIAELDRRNKMVAKHLAQIKKCQAQQNKPATKTERRNFYMLILRSNASWKAKDFKGMTFEQIEEKFIPVWEKMQDFVPMNSKLESERLKRPGIQLGKESFKKLKTAEASSTKPTQEQQSEEPKELYEEELKKMELVPVEELYIKALQVTNIQKKDKIKATTDKTEHRMEKREKSKSTNSKSTKVKVKDGAETEEMLNGLTHTHLIGQQPFILEESPVDTMVDQRTMAELLCAPTEGYAEEIVVPQILAEHFELKHNLINMMTSDQFFRLKEDNPQDHIRTARHWLEKEPRRSILTWEDLVSKFINEFFPPSRMTNLRNEISNFQQRFHESFHEAWDRYKDLLRCLAADGNTFLEFRDNIQGYVSAAAVNYIQDLLSNKEKLLELANTPLNENCSAVTIMKLLEKLRDLGKFLIPCGFSELKCKTLADLGANINLMPLFVWKNLGLPELISTRMTLELANQAICTPARIARDVFIPVGKFTFPADSVTVDYESDPRDYLEDLFATNHLSGNLTFSSHTDLTSIEVKDDIFDLEGDIVLIEKLLNLDSTKDLPSPHNINPLSGSTTSSSLNHLLEEFADELALITFPSKNNDLLNHADPNDNLVGTIPKMFTDEHALDYSSPPLYDDYEFKLLIDELDLPRSIDFLPSPEYNSFLFEDFSKVEALPSTKNKDKVFNLGILIHENLSEITVQVALDKNVKKISISNASLILEDFDPPLYELPFHKEVLGSKTLLSFLCKNEEKVFKPEILTSKGVHTSLLLELSHRVPKVFKVIKIFKSLMEILPCSYGEDIRILDVSCLHFYPS
nr:reverse transcriptase domain-containing protein [Tanacetum cinerariifolium]